MTVKSIFRPARIERLALRQVPKLLSTCRITSFSALPVTFLPGQAHQVEEVSLLKPTDAGFIQSDTVYSQQPRGEVVFEYLGIRVSLGGHTNLTIVLNSCLPVPCFLAQWHPVDFCNCGGKMGTREFFSKETILRFVKKKNRSEIVGICRWEKCRPHVAFIRRT